MRVRIIGNHNNHGFNLGEIVELYSTIDAVAWRFATPTSLGCGFRAKSISFKRADTWIVREIDFMPIGGKVV